MSDMRFNNLSVFLVEPSTTQANIIKGRLNDVGVQHIQVYMDGAQILAALRSHPSNVVVSAMHLQDMTGADLAVAIRNDAALQDVAFILVTSIDDPKQLDMVRQAGACAILPKPFNPDALRYALSNAVDYLNLGTLNIAGDADALKALIVDDSRTSRIFLRHALETMGIQHISEAGNGKQAVDLIAEQQYDMIFTDYNMPGMDGLQLLQYIRTQSWQSSVPVLLISSEQNPERLAAITAAGVSGICNKPFEPSTLKALTEAALNASTA